MDRRERAQRQEEVLARTLKQIPRRLHSLYLTFADPETERPSAIQIWTLKCLGVMGGSVSEDDDSHCERLRAALMRSLTESRAKLLN